MTTALVSKRAQQDLKRIKEHIAKADPEAAETVRSTILDIADLPAQTVEAGNRVINAPERFRDVRWFVVPRFRNYLISYRPHKDGILVIRILHAAQDWTRFFG